MSLAQLQALATTLTIIYGAAAVKADLVGYILAVQAEDDIVYTQAQLEAMTLAELKLLCDSRTITYDAEDTVATLVAAILSAQ